jgi:sugar phosphate isomerase/epimerase
MSTSWLYKSCFSGGEIADKIIETGLHSMEINFQIREKIFRELREEKRSGRLKITSLHNICPVTEEMLKVKNYSNYFNLSTSDKDVRKKTVDMSEKTLQHASELEAEAVVFHLGELDDASIQNEEKDYRKPFKKKSVRLGDHRQFFDELIKRREKGKAKPIDNIRRSLDYLVPAAERLGVKIGIENRYYISQIPNFHEIGFFMRQYDSGNLGFWYDMGHAANISNLGYQHYLDYLREYNTRLVGIHIHDCKGIVDHLPPGEGDIDFEAVKKLINNDILYVLELNSDLNFQDATRGIEYLNSIDFLN